MQRTPRRVAKSHASRDLDTRRGCRFQVLLENGNGTFELTNEQLVTSMPTQAQPYARQAEMTMSPLTRACHNDLRSIQRCSWTMIPAAEAATSEQSSWVTTALADSLSSPYFWRYNSDGTQSRRTLEYWCPVAQNEQSCASVNFRVPNELLLHVELRRVYDGRIAVCIAQKQFTE